MMNRIRQYFLLMRFHQPIGIFLLLWPTLWGVWIAGNGHPNLWIVCVFVAGVILMRAAGCLINDFADRHFDGKVKRTAKRPLATGAVTSKETLILFSVLVLLAFGLVLTLNPLTIFLSFIALGLAASYPFMKRITHWPQVVLGLAFSFGIPMAFAAQTNHVHFIAWVIMLSATLWTLAYDTQYAMVDRDDDLIIGIKSTAVLFGQYDVPIIIGLQILVITILLIIGLILGFNLYYYIGVVTAMLLIIYQQWLIRSRHPQQCFKAFLNNHWVGLVIFLGIVLNYAL